MESLGERLHYIRKKKGYTQTSPADAIGVSRGVIFNLEKNKTIPQKIVINAICQVLKINEAWLLSGKGEADAFSDTAQSTKILTELCEVLKGLSEEEQMYILDTIKALKRLNNDKRHG